MIIGAYQFAGSGDIEKNYQRIKEGITKAAKQNVRLLLLQECALCGYPPIEVASLAKIDFDALSIFQEKICKLARKYDMFIALGTIRLEDNKYYNSLAIIGCNGEIIGYYDKKALWGWDCDNFEKGTSTGVYVIDGIKVGFRICFEVSFPELFRELYKEKTDICLISFCDVSSSDSIERYYLIRGHLQTRAMENAMTVISVSSISNYQTAPTAVIGENGYILKELNRNEESLLVYDYKRHDFDFGVEGRRCVSDKLIGRGRVNE